MQNLSTIKQYNETVENHDDFFLIFLDKSQLVITIIGLIANLGTSVTLIKNGQVGTRGILQFTGCFLSNEGLYLSAM